jgi:hypothetical protein
MSSNNGNGHSQHDNDAQVTQRTPLNFTDRLGIPVALGDKILFLPNSNAPTVMQLVSVDPILDPQMPPGAQRLMFSMDLAVAAMPGGAIPGFLVGVDAAPAGEPPAPPSPIIFPGGKH